MYDVIVIGAGVEGSATAYYLTSRYTKNVLLLEQFEASQSKGGSRGGSRCFHFDCDPDLELIKDSVPLWKEMENKSNRKLLWNNQGALSFGHTSNPGLSETRVKHLSDNGVTCSLLSAHDLRTRYPNRLCTPDKYQCLYFDDGGAIDVRLTLKTMQEQFVCNGGELKDCHRVVRLIMSDNHIVTVETDRGMFNGVRVVLATGVWTNEILKMSGIGLDLPMKMMQLEAYYFKFNAQSYTVENFPVFLDSVVYSDDEKVPAAIYGVPSLEYPGLIKVCACFGDCDTEVDFECVVKDHQVPPSASSLTKVQRFIKTHFVGVDCQPSIHETCVLGFTPDYNPYIDHHPAHSNVIVVGGFCRGFKMAPTLGKIAAELAMDKPLSHDITAYKINRFNTSK